LAKEAYWYNLAAFLSLACRFIRNTNLNLAKGKNEALKQQRKGAASVWLATNKPRKDAGNVPATPEFAFLVST
jgi:hypothetical protein